MTGVGSSLLSLIVAVGFHLVSLVTLTIWVPSVAVTTVV